MFRKNNQHPAERAVMGIFVRLIGCAYLIYTIYKLISAPAEDKPAPWLTVLILVILIGLSAVVIGMTIHEFVTGVKSGRYKRSSYPNVSIFGDELESDDESSENAENALTDDEAAPSGEDEPADEDDEDDSYDEDDVDEVDDEDGETPDIE